MSNYLRKFKFIISVILAILTAIMLPVEVFAQSNPKQKPSAKVHFDSLAESEDIGEIVMELKERRDEYTKHFRMDDGTIMAVVYDVPVHYKNKKGKWEDYDNTLISESTASPDEASQVSYSNKKGKLDIDFASETSDAALISLNSSKGNLSWEYIDAKKSNIKIDKSKKKLRGNDRFTSIDRLSSKASYKSIYDKVNLDCIISSVGVKENLILQDKSAQNEYEIIYDIKGLKAKQADKQTIKLYKNKKAVYTISAPCMYDSKRNFSEKLTLKILECKSDKLKVKLRADEDFLCNATYPVTIDPSVTISGASYVKTAEVYDVQPNTVLGQQTSFHIGRTSSGNYYGLIKCENLNNIFSDKIIVNAKLNFYSMYGNNDMEIEAYPVTSTWSNSTATYNNVSYGSEVIDYIKTKNDDSDNVSLDITKLFKKWENGTIDNNGIYLKSDDTFNSFGGYACYYSNKKPTFTVKYKDYNGSEKSLTSHSVPCGQNADANISDYTGALTIKQNIYEEKGVRIPLNIYATHHSTNIDQRSYIGKGWHMSFDKRLRNIGTYYVYLDSDAIEHYFEIVSGKTELTDEDESGFTLKIKSNSIEIDNGSTIETYDIPDSNQTEYIKTEKDSNNSNNIITYNYETMGYLSSIVSAQHTYTFSYSTVTYEGNSIKVCNNLKKDGSTFISFSYYTGYALTYGIKFSDGKRSTFSYSNDYISNIRQYSTSDSQNGQKLGFTYTNGKVTKVTEYGKNDTSRKSLSIKYNTNNTTEFTDLNGNKETYTFDDYGNTISTLNANGMVTNGSDSGSLGINTGSDSYTKNYIDESNEINGIGNNYFFKKGDGTIGSQHSSGGQVTVATDHSYLGSNAIRVTHNGSSQIYTYAAHTSDAGDLAGKTVTLSSYVLTSGIEEGNLSGAAGAIIKIKCLNQSGTTILDRNSVPLIDTCSGNEEGWMRLSLTVDFPSNTDKYRIYFGIRNAQGDAWFDCMQLEEGDVMNDYNALSNSDFTSTSDWTYKYKDTGDTSFHTEQIPLDNDGDVHVLGKGCEPQLEQPQSTEGETEPTVATETRIETETIDNDTVEETDSYGNVIQTLQGEVTRTYRRTYEITEGTEETEETTGPAEPQQGEENTGLTKDCNNFIFQELDVDQKHVTFNISGTASAKSVPLNSEYRTFGVALTVKYQGDTDYTENHYQKFNAYTDSTQNITLSVTPNQPDKKVEKVAFAFVYGYNKNEMIIKNAMLNFAYDYQFSGNTANESGSDSQSAAEIDEEIISESVNTAQAYMQTNTGYNSSGNYIISETDEAGHTTSNSYDSDGNKTSFTDGKGNITSYTYDTQNNLLSVASGDSSYSNTYTSTGQISTISNSGTSYSYEYDDFDNITKVKVGSQTLVTNTYDSLCDKLTQTTYGNGGFLAYTYDDYGRITRISVAGAFLAEYKYNKKGLITEYYDGWRQLTTYFYYDCNGNIIAKYAEDEDTKLAYYVWLDGDITRETTNIDGRFHEIVSGTNENDGEYVKNDGVLITTENDDFGRRQCISTKFTSETGTPTYNTEYEYLNKQQNSEATTNLIGNITYTYGNNSTEYEYQYDANNNITQVKTNGVIVAKYTYDSINQLETSAERNAVNSNGNGGYKEYEYDNKGNITQVDEYSLTGSLGKNTSYHTVKEYSYDDSNWGDKLTEYDDQTLTYDNIGNPINYRDGMTMQWHVGRQLYKINTGDDTVKFSYNADGLRTSKENSEGTSYYYYDNNNNMIALKKNNSIMYFQYDSEGNVVSMTFEGSRYYYIKNQQGDIEKIIDHSGNAVVTYKYNAWGKLCDMTDTSGVWGIGSMNPFRYREYIFDDETGLYYLQSRYYDPVTGRFLNADTYTNTGTDSLLSINMFAYCVNNAVAFYDPDGLYNRKKAVIYAKKWYKKFNFKFPRYSQDCTNFISQCLYAGGIKMNLLWHSYRLGYSDMYYIWCFISTQQAKKALINENLYKYMYNWNVSLTWSKVVNNYNYFRSSKFVLKKISFSLYKLTNKKQKKYIKKYGIREGDLMYFDQDCNSVVDHAAIISDVSDNIIKYAAHTDPHKSKRLKGSKNKKSKIYILIMR